MSTIFKQLPPWLSILIIALFYHQIVASSEQIHSSDEAITSAFTETLIKTSSYSASKFRP